MEVTIENIALRMKVYEGTILRLSEYFGIHVYDQTIGALTGSKAILSESFVSFLEDNSNFYKKYHDDYHSAKNPEIIAETLNREVKLVHEFMKNRFPEFYENGKFKSSCEKDLKYISSYEIDFRLGNGNRINMNSLGKIAWHLGFKQQMIIDKLKAEARERKSNSSPYVREVYSA